MGGYNHLRLALFFLVAALHGVLILFLAFPLETPEKGPEPEAKIMKLVDLTEAPPPPPEIPPPPAAPPQQSVEAVAETLVETDEVPPDQVVVASLPYDASPQQGPRVSSEPEYLPQHLVTKVPIFSERDIRKNLVYPPIALRSNVEGVVVLLLFVDARGDIQQITVLKEEPQGRGFGEAALRAFQGVRATRPAEANGAAVGIQYRYPIRFTLR